MDIFELDVSTVHQLQTEGFQLLERANFICSSYFFPDCDCPPLLEWDEICLGARLLLGNYTGRVFEVILNHFD